jgi:hypothetical protein
MTADDHSLLDRDHLRTCGVCADALLDLYGYGAYADAADRGLFDPVPVAVDA